MKKKNSEISNLPDIVRTAQNIDGEGVFGISMGNKGKRTIPKEILLPDGTTKTVTIIVGVDGDSTLYLGTFEQEVYYVITSFWHKQGMNESGVVYFSLYECLEKLKLSKSQRNYEWLKEKIFNLRHTPIVFNGSYKKKDGTYSPTTDSITIFSHHHLGEENFIIFHPVVLKSLIDKHYSPIRLDEFSSIKTPVSRALYTNVSYAFYGIEEGKVYHKDLLDLAEAIGINMNRRRDHIHKLMEKGIKQLIGKDTTSGPIKDARIIKSKGTSKSPWVVEFEKGKERPISDSLITLINVPKDVLKSLTEEEITKLNKLYNDKVSTSQFIDSMKFLSNESTKEHCRNGLKIRIAEEIIASRSKKS